LKWTTFFRCNYFVNMRKYLIAYALIVSAFMIQPDHGLATQIIQKSPQQLGEASELVVLGKVASVQSYWNEKRTKMFTKTQIHIETTYKGQKRQSVDIIQLGGVVDNVRVTVSGALQWKQGEEVLLFLEPYMKDQYQVSGFSQGRYEIERDKETGKAYVKVPSLEKSEIASGNKKQPAVQSASMKKETVEQFVQRILNKP
jgi:hypothetical protein